MAKQTKPTKSTKPVDTDEDDASFDDPKLKSKFSEEDEDDFDLPMDDLDELSYDDDDDF
ncbi:hypothetical protein [Pedobacter arcticus]|uniref:hypothetical protein n=1 Tax=Pedobacter arcticus TaxID=752140 RepID=UPI0003072A24|nr:hypothetical protein [Pedobacter arcticus]